MSRLSKEDADERRVAAIWETPRLYGEAARRRDEALSDAEREHASVQAEAPRELARGLVGSPSIPE